MIHVEFSSQSCVVSATCGGTKDVRRAKRAPITGHEGSLWRRKSYLQVASQSKVPTVQCCANRSAHTRVNWWHCLRATQNSVCFTCAQLQQFVTRLSRNVIVIQSFEQLPHSLVHVVHLPPVDCRGTGRRALLIHPRQSPHDRLFQWHKIRPSETLRDKHARKQKWVGSRSIPCTAPAHLRCPQSPQLPWPSEQLLVLVPEQQQGKEPGLAPQLGG